MKNTYTVFILLFIVFLTLSFLYGFGFASGVFVVVLFAIIGIYFTSTIVYFSIHLLILGFAFLYFEFFSKDEIDNLIVSKPKNKWIDKILRFSIGLISIIVGAWLYVELSRLINTDKSDYGFECDRQGCYRQHE